MAFKIIWSPESETTFDNIINYLEIEWTGKEIQKLFRATEKVIHLISQNPFLFRRSEKHNVYEVLIGKQNLLLYQVVEEFKEVQLLSFWDTRQNPKSKFKNQF